MPLTEPNDTAVGYLTYTVEAVRIQIGDQEVAGLVRPSTRGRPVPRPPNRTALLLGWSLKECVSVTVHLIVLFQRGRLGACRGEMSGSATAEMTLPAEPLTAGRARRAVRESLEVAGATHLLEVAELVVSELVTNAVVHAGTQMHVRIVAEPEGIRVEVGDGNDHLPMRRSWSDAAGTGRGLRIVDELADRWGAHRTEDGKIVWFEVGRLAHLSPITASAAALPSGSERIVIRLLSVPLLMHWAWQEHAATLLREYLLYSLEQDPRALDDHAAASNALSVLDEQLPTPRLPTEARALMASSVEPDVTAPEVALRINASSVRHFEVLDDLLTRAVAAAEDGYLLSPPTQPEMAEMRAWLCGEVAGQARADEPRPWRADADVRTVVDSSLSQTDAYQGLLDKDDPIIVTDGKSVIVAVSPLVVAFLGYRRESDLLGRRILVVVPTRFHQAHIAGTTLHVTNGRDALLNQWLTVPMVRADGTETPVGLHVAAHGAAGDTGMFVAHLRW